VDDGLGRKQDSAIPFQRGELVLAGPFVGEGAGDGSNRPASHHHPHLVLRRNLIIAASDAVQYGCCPCGDTLAAVMKKKHNLPIRNSLAAEEGWL
jgi:hypothetical protein